jgi:benzoate-CoA ligase family protein
MYVVAHARNLDLNCSYAQQYAMAGVLNTLNMADAILDPPLARGQGGHPAILCGEERVSFAELAERVARAGNALYGLGVAAGDRVVLVASDRPVFFYAYLGLMKLGAVPCALNLRLSAADIAYIIQDSGARLVLCDAEFGPQVSEAVKGLAAPPPVVSLDDELPNLMAIVSPQLASVQRPADAPGFWMYSSGTTGKPKGVVHAQRTVFMAPEMFGTVLQVAPGDRVFASSKLFFAFALGHVMFATLQRGATAVLFPGWPDAEAIAAIVERHQPTVMLSVPTFYRNLLRSKVAERPGFKAVRHYLSAGEKLPKSLYDQWMAATGRPILDGIGATETCYLFLANRPDQLDPGTCGRPQPRVEVKLIAEDGHLVSEAGDPGVLWVKMPSVALGYWNMEERTRAIFQDGWYCTNDIFTFDAAGAYEYQGRSDDMLKISGQWVSPTEIEEHVLKHPQVSEAAVVGVPNDDGLVRLALFLVAPRVADRSSFEAELQSQLVAALSIYKCPRRTFYVDSMPMTATGKLQRYALRQIAITQGFV